MSLWCALLERFDGRRQIFSVTFLFDNWAIFQYNYPKINHSFGTSENFAKIPRSSRSAGARVYAHCVRSKLVRENGAVLSNETTPLLTWWIRSDDRTLNSNVLQNQSLYMMYVFAPINKSVVGFSFSL